VQKKVLWTTQILDAEDGSGDAIIELPEELMTQLGWRIGDELDFTVVEASYLQLTKRHKE
jgi:hypothetical protein